MVADDRHYGEGQHDQRDMAVPAMPRTGFIVVEAEFGLGRLEGVLDRPALSFDGDQGLDRRASRAPGAEEGAGAIGEATPDQQAARPDTGSAADILVGVKVGQFEIGPVVKPWPLRALA